MRRKKEKMIRPLTRSLKGDPLFVRKRKQKSVKYIYNKELATGFKGNWLRIFNLENTGQSRFSNNSKYSVFARIL